jgi:Family of unknown function (DUF6452)
LYHQKIHKFGFIESLLMRTFTILFFLSFILSFFACQKDETCDGTSVTPDLVVEFYYDSLNETTHKYDTIKYIMPDTLTLFGIGALDSIEQNSVNNQSFQLPLDINNTTTKFVFAIKNINSATAPSVLIYDTLTVNYQEQREFISQACGFKYIFPEANYSMTQHRVDTIQVLQNNIINDNSTHLRIFFNVK